MGKISVGDELLSKQGKKQENDERKLEFSSEGLSWS